MTTWRSTLTRVRANLGAVWLAIVAAIGIDELALALALGLIGLGCWMVWKPGAFLVPGLVLLWLALPSRAPFVSRPPDKPQPPSRRTS